MRARSRSMTRAPLRAATAQPQPRTMAAPLRRSIGRPRAGVRAAFTLRTRRRQRAALRVAQPGQRTSAMMPLAVGRESASRRCRARNCRAEPLWLAQVHGTTVVDADAGLGRGTRDGAAGRCRRHAPGRGACWPCWWPTACRCCWRRATAAAVAVAHAGWRGLAAGVLEATVAAIGGAGARCRPGSGRRFGPAHFEVGEEVRDGVLRARRAAAARLRAPMPAAAGNATCIGSARQRLCGARVCVRSMASRAAPTREPQSFYSYRRDGVTGRMAALIWLEAAHGVR